MITSLWTRSVAAVVSDRAAAAAKSRAKRVAVCRTAPRRATLHGIPQTASDALTTLVLQITLIYSTLSQLSQHTLSSHFIWMLIVFFLSFNIRVYKNIKRSSTATYIYIIIILFLLCGIKSVINYNKCQSIFQLPFEINIHCKVKYRSHRAKCV